MNINQLKNELIGEERFEAAEAVERLRAMLKRWREPEIELECKCKLCRDTDELLKGEE